MNQDNIDYNKIISDSLKQLSTEIKSDKTTIALPHPEDCWVSRRNMIYHTDYEIFYQIDGGCRFVFPKEEQCIYPGDAIVVPPGTPHVEHSFGLNGCQFRNLVFIIYENRFTIHVAQSGIPGLRFDQPSPVFTPPLNTSRNPLYWKLAGLIAEPESLNSESGSRIAARRSALGTITAMLVEDIGKQAGEPQGHYKVNMVKAIIGGYDVKEMPTIAELSKRVGLSANYLSWLFHKETGTTIKYYINRVKIDCAKNMLRSTTWTISEVARQCGFRDASYFSRIFERHCKTKPLEYRTKLR